MAGDRDEVAVVAQRLIDAGVVLLLLDLAELLYTASGCAAVLAARKARVPNEVNSPVSTDAENAEEVVVADRATSFTPKSWPREGGCDS